jgi:hypothetical protein
LKSKLASENNLGLNKAELKSFLYLKFILENKMQMVKSYITDEDGKIKDVIISYDDFRKLEDLFLDLGLGKSMEEIVSDEEVRLEKAKEIFGFKHGI